MAYRSLPLLLLAGALALGVSGCPDDDDDGTTDSGVTDTGTTDTGVDTGVDGGADAGVDGGPEDTGTPDSGGPQEITLIHTNDEQSQMLGFAPNIDDYPNRSNSEEIRGGVHRRAYVLEQLSMEAQAAGEPFVLLNGGDLTMGSLFHVANLFASPDYVLLSQLGYHAGTLGNHEFDFGPGILAQMISQGRLVDPLNQTFGVLQVPLVVSNIRFSASSPDDDTLAALWSESGETDRPIQRYHIEEFGDVTVGFVGYMGLDAALVAPFKAPVSFSLAVDPQATCTNDGQCPGSVCVPPASDPVAMNGNCALDPNGSDPSVNFPALVADVASAVAEVRAMGADLVVAVSHAGVDERELAMLEAMGMGPENAMRSEDILVALGVDRALEPENIPGIDVIVGGHSHTPLFEPLRIPNAASGITTFVVQAGGNGEYVGRIRLTRGSGTAPWAIDAESSELIELDGSVTGTVSGVVTQLVIDGLIEGVIAGLEGTDAARPGDGLLFPGEQCDGTLIPNAGNCLNLIPGATGGTLGCEANRQLDLSACTFDAPSCGDDTADAGEQCDGADIPMDCAALGYEGGTIGCHANCAFDFSGCTAYFPSLLEIALNFQRTPEDPVLRDDDQTLGDLFFYILGQASFDVGETIPHNESNIANLVADSARWAVNTLDPDASDFPVELAIVANGVIRDGIYMGMTGALSFADLFRVLPLGISPQEGTPGYTLVDFYLSVPEVKVGLEVSLSRGRISDSFWLGISGARVTYDLSRPAFDPANPLTTGYVTRIELIEPFGKHSPWDDTQASYEGTPLFEIVNDAPVFDPARYIHVTTSLYISLFMQGFGLCPRIDETGTQFGGCGACVDDNDCTVAGSTCDTTAGRCSGGPPAGFFLRTQVPFGTGFFQELKEVLALTTYIRRLPNGDLPVEYSGPTPRRMCCVGTACPEDMSRTCN